MILGDAEVDGGVPHHGEQGFRFHDVAGMQDELEFLLVDGGGGEAGGFHAGEEPVRRRSVGLVEVLQRLQGMLYAGTGPVAQGDDAMHDVPFAEREGARNLLVGEPDPAAVEPQRLGQQDQGLAVIADLFLGFLPFRAGHHEVVPHPGELAVFPYAGGEGLRLLQDQLDVQPAFPVEARDGVLQGGRLVRLDGFVRILPHGMPCLDCVDKFHIAKITIFPQISHDKRKIPLRLT